MMKIRSLFSRNFVKKQRLPWIAAGGAAVLGLVAWNGATAADPNDAKDAATSIQSAAVSLAEDADHYTVTIPTSSNSDADMDIRLEGRTLHIGSAASASGARFEQNFVLPDADPQQSPNFDQQNDKLVVTVPKSKPHAASMPAAPQHSVASQLQLLPPQDPNMDAWSQHVMTQFQQMQQRMDRMMNHAFGNMGQPDPFAGFDTMMGGMGGVNLQDDGSEYVIRANIPGLAADDVNVAVDNDRVLRITAKNETSGSGSYRTSNFTQMMTLPGPVQSDKIQVEQDDGGVVIKLPKA